MSTPTTLAQYDAAIATLKKTIATLQSTLAQDKAQVQALNSQIQTLQTEIGQAQAAQANTIVSYGPWSTCSSGGTQTRTVTYGNGRTATQTQNCTPPVVVVGVSPWSACSSGGTQTRTVTYSNGTTQTQTRSCSPPTITSYGAWGTCTNGTQLRFVYWSDGNVTSQTRSCTVAPTVVYSFKKYISFSSRTCEWKYEIYNHMSDGTNVATGQYVYETNYNCTPTISG